MRILIIFLNPRTTARTSRLRPRTRAPPPPPATCPPPPLQAAAPTSRHPRPATRRPRQVPKYFLHRKISCFYRQYCRYRLLPDDARVVAVSVPPGSRAGVSRHPGQPGLVQPRHRGAHQGESRGHRPVRTDWCGARRHPRHVLRLPPRRGEVRRKQ